MILRNWTVIIVLAATGLALGWYWFTLPSVPDGVSPQGGMDETVTAVAALAGAITTIGGSIFGVLGKLNEYKKAKLEIAEKELALAQKQQELQKE